MCDINCVVLKTVLCLGLGMARYSMIGRKPASSTCPLHATWISLMQRLPTFLMPRPFKAVPQVVVTSNHTITLLVLPNCFLLLLWIVMQISDMQLIWCVTSKGVMTHRLGKTALMSYKMASMQVLIEIIPKTNARHGGAGSWSQRSVDWDRRIMSLRLAWAT